MVLMRVLRRVREGQLRRPRVVRREVLTDMHVARRPVLGGIIWIRWHGRVRRLCGVELAVLSVVLLRPRSKVQGHPGGHGGQGGQARPAHVRAVLFPCRSRESTRSQRLEARQGAGRSVLLLISRLGLPVPATPLRARCKAQRTGVRRGFEQRHDGRRGGATASTTRRQARRQRMEGVAVGKLERRELTRRRRRRAHRRLRVRVCESRVAGMVGVGGRDGRIGRVGGGGGWVDGGSSSTRRRGVRGVVVIRRCSGTVVCAKGNEVTRWLRVRFCATVRQEREPVVVVSARRNPRPRVWRGTERGLYDSPEGGGCVPVSLSKAEIEGRRGGGATSSADSPPESGAAAGCGSLEWTTGWMAGAEGAALTGMAKGAWVTGACRAEGGPGGRRGDTAASGRCADRGWRHSTDVRVLASARAGDRDSGLRPCAASFNDRGTRVFVVCSFAEGRIEWMRSQEGRFASAGRWGDPARQELWKRRGVATELEDSRSTRVAVLRVGETRKGRGDAREGGEGREEKRAGGLGQWNPGKGRGDDQISSLALARPRASVGPRQRSAALSSSCLNMRMLARCCTFYTRSSSSAPPSRARRKRTQRRPFLRRRSWGRRASGCSAHWRVVCPGSGDPVALWLDTVSLERLEVEAKVVFEKVDMAMSSAGPLYSWQPNASLVDLSDSLSAAFPARACAIVGRHGRPLTARAAELSTSDSACGTSWRPSVDAADASVELPEESDLRSQCSPRG